MRTLSRHLPAAPEPQTTMMGKVVVFLFLGIFTASLLYAVYCHPIVSLVVAIIFTSAGVVSYFRSKKHAEKMLAQRAEEKICSFRRSFNLHHIDPWIVRAVYEEMFELVDRPLRASDRLEEDLRIDPEDLEDVATNVAVRAGYDLGDNKQNPFYGKLKTVGDLVMFFTHQRKLRVESCHQPQRGGIAPAQGNALGNTLSIRPVLKGRTNLTRPYRACLSLNIYPGRCPGLPWVAPLGLMNSVRWPNGKCWAIRALSS
jgi:hypothetical protein